jgi:cell division protein FtsQ
VKRNRRGPPPRPQKVSRLARIKLDGGAHWKDMARRRKERGAHTTLAGALLVGGAALAGAAWIGGALFDTGEALSMGADGIAGAAGLHATLEVRGVDGQKKRDVEQVALPEGRRSIMAASPARIRDNVESLDWVESAEVARLWPSTIRIEVKRRTAVALWQEDRQITVVDAAGERVHGARIADYAYLPRVVGPGAGPAAEKVVSAIEELPELRARLKAFERVGERRWDLHLKNGMVILLPEREEVAALYRLEALQRTHRVLDRNYARLDVRDVGRLVAQPRVAPPPTIAVAAAPKDA